MLSTCNKVVQYSWKSSSKLQKTDNDIHNNLSDCGFAVWLLLQVHCNPLYYSRLKVSNNKHETCTTVNIKNTREI